MAVGPVVRRGILSALALAGTVVGLTWLNRVAAAVMEVGGSCGRGGPYEVSVPCPSGVWMAPAGIVGGLACLGLYVYLRPRGSPQLAFLAWPALFASLGIQFLRAGADRGGAGYWVCGVLFLLLAAVPVVIAVVKDPRGALRTVAGDGRARRNETDPETWDPDDLLGERYPPGLRALLVFLQAAAVVLGVVVGDLTYAAWSG